jgi:uncharacterized OsmC-like protein
MSQSEKIKSAFERQSKAVELRSGIGKGTAVTKVRVRNGLTCEIEEGKWKMVADMNPKWGGNDQGPNPGIFGRGALGSCLTMGYIMWAAKLGIDIDDLEVEIHADYDTRGMCGADETLPGYLGIKYLVRLSSSSSEDEIIKMLDTADKYSSYFDVFTREVKLERAVELKKIKE